MAFVTPVMEYWLEREIAKWVNPIKDRSDDPSHHERTLFPQSYISLPKIKKERYLIRQDNIKMFDKKYGTRPIKTTETNTIVT